jgi:thiol:disulfide interchange protein
MLAIVSGFALWWMAPFGSSMRRKVLAWGIITGTLAGSLWLIQQSKQSEDFSAMTEPYSAARLETLRDEGAKVFVYGTADWCITCKVNEKLALNDASVIAHIQEQGITVLQADWTDYNNEITTFLRSHERAGVPIYVYYTPDAPAQLLPQILTPALIKKALR